MKVDHFACWFKLDNIHQYLIWICGEPDSIHLRDDLRIPVFSSEMALAQYALSKDISIENQAPVLHDLDAAERWIQNTSEPIDCYELLAAWNLFTDVSYALNMPFKGNRDYQKRRSTVRDKIYDKLFYGNNIYNLTPENEYYIPMWTNREREKIAEIITDGLVLFRQGIAPINTHSYKQE
ncbi:hypothetical protein [Spirosoma arcticum]